MTQLYMELRSDDGTTVHASGTVDFTTTEVPDSVDIDALASFLTTESQSTSLSTSGN